MTRLHYECASVVDDDNHCAYCAEMWPCDGALDELPEPTEEEKLAMIQNGEDARRYG